VKAKQFSDNGCLVVDERKLVVATAMSRTYAKRIANALNVYKTKQERKHDYVPGCRDCERERRNHATR
jgi:hypothetical protein